MRAVAKEVRIWSRYERMVVCFNILFIRFTCEKMEIVNFFFLIFFQPTYLAFGMLCCW